jgi:hypothetical protein
MPKKASSGTEDAEKDTLIFKFSLSIISVGGMPAHRTLKESMGPYLTLADDEKGIKKGIFDSAAYLISIPDYVKLKYIEKTRDDNTVKLKNACARFVQWLETGTDLVDPGTHPDPVDEGGPPKDEEAVKTGTPSLPDKALVSKVDDLAKAHEERSSKHNETVEKIAAMGKTLEVITEKLEALLTKNHDDEGSEANATLMPKVVNDTAKVAVQAEPSLPDKDTADLPDKDTDRRLLIVEELLKKLCTQEADKVNEKAKGTSSTIPEARKVVDADAKAPMPDKAAARNEKAEGAKATPPSTEDRKQHKAPISDTAAVPRKCNKRKKEGFESSDEDVDDEGFLAIHGRAIKLLTSSVRIVASHAKKICNAAFNHDGGTPQSPQ